MHRTSPGQVKRRRAVERISVAAGGLGGDQKLGVHKDAQSLRRRTQMSRYRAERVEGQSALEMLPQISAKPGQAISNQARRFSDSLRRPEWQAKRQSPQGVSGLFLPTEEPFSLWTKGGATFVPASFVAPASHDRAVGQVHGHRRVAGSNRPPVDPSSPAQDIHRPTGVEASGQRSSGVEAIIVTPKSTGAPARIRVGFQHRNLQARSGQQSCGCQPPYACADDYYLIHRHLRGNQG